MSSSPRVGLGLNGEGLSIGDIVDIAAAAEDSGLDSFWHGENQREPWVPLAAAAARTSRIRIGTGVALWARGAVATELAAANLDELARGRFVLGLGTGPRVRNEDWYGIPYRNASERMTEFVELLRRMWTAHDGAVVDHRGRHLTLRGYRRALRPVRERIPIYLGASRRRMLEAAGAIADGVLLDALTTPADAADRALPQILDGAARAGRDRAELEIGTMLLGAVSEDRSQARRWARGQIAYYVRGTHADLILRRHGFERQAARVRAAAERYDHDAMVAAVDDEMVATLAAAGSPGELRARVREFSDLDLVVIVLPAYGLGRDEILANARAVLDALRELAPDS